MRVMSERYMVGCVLMLFLFSISAAILKTSTMPIHLALNRVSLGPNATQIVESSRSVRSKPKLFENVLGLFPGTPFEFRIDRWRALQYCGLFGNLSVRSISDNNGVALIISGVERPSITFQPEASVGLSLTNPDINGGLVWRDSNFRGLGETMEVLISKKEGLEEGTDSLQPYLRAKWKANSIGRLSTVSVGVESSEEIVNIANYLSPSKISGLQTRFSNFIHNLRKPIKSTSIIFTLQQQLTDSPFLWGIEPYFRSFSQSPKLDFSASKNSDFQLEKSIISGTKFFCQTVLLEKMRLSAWWDRGSSMQKGDFSHSGVTLDLPSFKLPFFRSSPHTRKASSDSVESNKLENSQREDKSRVPSKTTKTQILDIDSTAQQPQQDEDDSMTVTCQLHAEQAWGIGKLPFLHHISAAKSSWFRGFPLLQAKDSNHVIERMACIKTDLILPWPKTVQLGLFLDAGVYASDRTNSETADDRRKNSRDFTNFGGLTTNAMFTSGVSLRFGGFKVEVGSPVLQPTRARVYFGVDPLTF